MVHEYVSACTRISTSYVCTCSRFSDNALTKFQDSFLPENMVRAVGLVWHSLAFIVIYGPAGYAAQYVSDPLSNGPFTDTVCRRWGRADPLFPVCVCVCIAYTRCNQHRLQIIMCCMDIRQFFFKQTTGHCYMQ